ncbi:sodium channel protein Nach-like [Anthonomus grandis grandis]|uniref:sodium channel protein Nach-like n=1 Tax=Anthonomus grandis grandis TaxID=2921223 RepID=UPI00216629A0|nr:sodium channel protein Nach-like [Anthonomus grandis grandis]
MARGLKFKTLNKTIVHFCQETSLHGWKYVVLQHTSKFERLIWLILCGTSLGIAIYFLTTAWMTYESSPTITLTESTQFEIYKYPFPAVTLCSFNKISKRAAYDMAKKLNENSSSIESLAQSFKLLYHLVNYNNQNIPRSEYDRLNQVLRSRGKTEEEVFEAISPSCHKLIKKCFWKGERKKCEDMFEKIKTPIGYCCAFNYFGLRNMSRKKTAFRYPSRTSSCGFQSGLEVLIDNDPNDYFATHIPSIGYRVLIHYPYDIPDWSVRNTLCEISTNNFIGLNPEIITATDNIKGMSASDRKCLFPKERTLEMFESYTFHNCLNEYLKNKTRICSLKDIQCIFEKESLYLNLMFNETYSTQRNREFNGKCRCLSSCESVTYTPEASKGALYNSFSTNQFLISSGVNVENHTIIRVFFNDLLGTRHRRDAVYTWHTLLGYYGGILGLFTGFSFISAVEIIYFLVIGCFTRGNMKKSKKTTQNDVFKFAETKTN